MLFYVILVKLNIQQLRALPSFIPLKYDLDDLNDIIGKHLHFLQLALEYDGEPSRLEIF